MANRVRGEVAVEIDGKSWTLRYGTNALCELEDKLAQPINVIMAMLQDREALRIKTIRSVVWAGLREKHPEVTEKDAGDLISAIGFPAMMAKVAEALKAAFPDDPDEGSAADRPQ